MTGRLLRRLWLVVLLQAGLMAVTMVLYPPFQNPDEVAHVDYVLAHRHGEWLDAPGERRYQSGTLAALAQVPAIRSGAHLGGSTPPRRSQRQSFDALGTAPAGIAIPNQMTQHPPLYYGLAAGFSYLLPGFSRRGFDVQLAWLRLLSLLLLLPVPVLIFGAASRLSGSRPAALTASLLPLSVPSYLRTGASVTNDSLAVLLTTLVLAVIVRVALGDLSRWTALALGVAWGGALLTKGFALVLVPAVLAAYLVGARRDVSPAGRDVPAGRSGGGRPSFGAWHRGFGAGWFRLGAAWAALLITGGVAFAIGGWWWLRNLLDFGTVQPDGLGPHADALRVQLYGSSRPGDGELDFLQHFCRLLAVRLWGSLGLIDDPTLSHGLLDLLALGLAALLVGSLLMGRSGTGHPVPSWRTERAVVLLLPALGTLLVMYLSARRQFLANGQLGGIQTRYLLPAMLGVLSCAAVALHRWAGRFERWLPATALTGALLWLAASDYTLLDRTLSSDSASRWQRLADALRFAVGWAPVPGVLSMLLLVGTGMLAGLALAGFWLAAGLR